MATDGSPTAEKATETAIELARLLDTELVIVCVRDIAYAAVGLAPMPISGELAKMEEKGARKVVADAAALAEEAEGDARDIETTAERRRAPFEAEETITVRSR